MQMLSGLVTGCDDTRGKKGLFGSNDWARVGYNLRIHNSLYLAEYVLLSWVIPSITCKDNSFTEKMFRLNFFKIGRMVGKKREKFAVEAHFVSLPSNLCDIAGDSRF